MPGKHKEIEINRNSLKDVQTLPEADTDSDHNLVVVKICTIWEDEEEDVNCFWFTLRKREDNGS